MHASLSERIAGGSRRAVGPVGKMVAAHALMLRT
jgi:hypothetical protein